MPEAVRKVESWIRREAGAIHKARKTGGSKVSLAVLGGLCLSIQAPCWMRELLLGWNCKVVGWHRKGVHVDVSQPTWLWYLSSRWSGEAILGVYNGSCSQLRGQTCLNWPQSKRKVLYH